MDDIANKSLYGLELDFYEMMTEIEELGGEITPEMEEKLLINRENLEAKVKGYSYFINKLKAEQIAIKEEKDRLSLLADRKQNMIDRLKSSLKDAVVLFGDKGKSGNSILEFDTIKLYTRKNEKLLFSNEEQFYITDYMKYSLLTKLSPAEFGRLKTALPDVELEDRVAIDKKTLKDDLKGGVEIDGVSLIRDDSVIIK